VNKYEGIINGIYCLSQEACTTLTNLRTVPNIALSIEGYRLYVLLDKLHIIALEAFKAINVNLEQEYEEKYLKELLAIGSIIIQIYDVFKINTELPQEDIRVEKLDNHINSLSMLLFKLHDLEIRYQTFSRGGLVVD
jgi:hypothetical protein